MEVHAMKKVHVDFSKAYRVDPAVYSTSSKVRKNVAKKGTQTELARLINDPSPKVRKAVAKKGYGLEVLTHDPNLSVRTAALSTSSAMD